MSEPPADAGPPERPAPPDSDPTTLMRDAVKLAARISTYFCSRTHIPQEINQSRSGRMSMRRQSERMRKHAVADARWRPEVVVDPRAARAGCGGGREL